MTTDPAAEPSPGRVTDRVREHIVAMCAGPEGGHLGGSMSLVEILTTLYFDVLRVDPADPGAEGRDILILSKGHGAIALYAVLMYVYGKNGNAWLERSLRSRGYREVRGEAA